MTNEEKITMLNTYAKAWYSSSQADYIHEAIFRAQGFGKFADRCKEEGDEELEKIASELADDSITRKLVESFVECESEHREWVAKHLGIIDRIGYENYLIDQLG